MTRLEQIKDSVATTSESGSPQLQEYRLAAQTTPAEKKAQTLTAAAPEAAGYTDKGSSSTNEIIRHWKPDHGQSSSGKAWFKAMNHQESVPVTGNYYKVKDGDCLESIARRELRTQKHAADSEATNAGVAQLIALNKDHYKSLTVNEHYIQKGWTLKLSATDIAAAEAVATAPKPAEPKPADTPPPAAAAAIPVDNSKISGKPDILAPVPAPDAKAPDSSKAPDLRAPDAPPASNKPIPAAPDGSLHTPAKSPDFMDKLYSYGKEACDEGKELYNDHKWWVIGAGAVIGTAAIIASRGRISKLFGTEKELGATAQTIERDAVLAKVGAIPDVERPQIASFAGFDAQSQFEKAATDYRSSLFQLKHQLPTQYTLAETESVPALAKRVLEDRAPITGERINPESIEAEAARIRGLHPTIEATAGDPLLIHDETTLSKLAETTRFKHVPQLGQLLKQHGVSEDNIQEAFRVQSSLPKENRPLIGQILVDQKLATKDQVDHAFDQQNGLKAMLKDVQTEVMGR